MYHKCLRLFILKATMRIDWHEHHHVYPVIVLDLAIKANTKIQKKFLKNNNYQGHKHMGSNN